MPAEVLQLFPQPGGRRALTGLYLDARLHARGREGAPFVYANFISSLDGRIALADAPGEHSSIPEGVGNAADWRLFQELQAQCDCLITHGGYLRALAEGRLGNILQVGHDPAAADLRAWRGREALAAQPAVVVISASLDFPSPVAFLQADQRCYIATGERSDPARVGRWRELGFEVLAAGSGTRVQAGALVRALGARGFTSLYLAGGPRLLDSALRDGVLDRLYLTLAHRVVGGESFHTIVAGPALGDAGRLKLSALYYDPDSPPGVGQCFAQLDTPGRL